MGTNAANREKAILATKSAVKKTLIISAICVAVYPWGAITEGRIGKKAMSAVKLSDSPIAIFTYFQSAKRSKSKLSQIACLEHSHVSSFAGNRDWIYQKLEYFRWCSPSFKDTNETALCPTKAELLRLQV